MNVNVSCAQCGDGLKVVREWTDRGDLEITVMPCEYCLRQQQKPSPMSARNRAYGQGYHDGYNNHVKSIPHSDDDRDEVNRKAYEDGYRNGNCTRLRHEEAQ